MKKVCQWISVNDFSLFLNFCEVSFFRGIKSNNSRRFFVGVKNDEMVYLNQMVCFIKAQRGVWVLWYNLPTNCEMLCMVLGDHQCHHSNSNWLSYRAYSVPGDTPSSACCSRSLQKKILRGICGSLRLWNKKVFHTKSILNLVPLVSA